jgi:hypothetical protein
VLLRGCQREPYPLLTLTSTSTSIFCAGVPPGEGG